MAELYAKPFETIDTGYNPQQAQGGGQSNETQEYLSSLPPEERQAAIERLNAPLTGEELATLAQSGQKMPTVAEFAEIEKFHKNHEISFIDGLGKIAEGGEQFMTDISKAFGAMIDNPKDVASKMPATAVEAFSQGTRNFYGMLAQSSNTDSTLFKVKDFLNGTGTIEDRYNQYIQALKFNKDSMELAEGKQTMVMDADMINHEVTQAMAYIADPTLFIPFGKVASTGLRAVGLGEKLAMAGARSAAIKNGIIGNTLKWGVGQPLEFLGGAVRNTIDYGLDKAGAAFEATTGIGAKEFGQTARMSGIGFSASAIAGHAVPFASTVSDAYIVGSSARGFGEALTLMGETMSKNKFGRGINTWATEALEQAEKNGTVLSPHAKGLLKTLNAVDPLFAYGWNGLEGAAEGAIIGGGLGYLNAGEEGMYSGIGAGIAMGAVGATAGKMVADVTGGTNVARRAVQAKMVIEGHKVTNADKAMFFQAMQTAAEARGQDVDLVNGIIAGIDKVAPNFEFHAMTPEQFAVEAVNKGYNPYTGKFAERSAIDFEFGGDRASKSKAMGILRAVGGDFVGNSNAFLDALKKASAKDSTNPNKPAGNIPANLRKYTDVAKTFDKLTKTQQDAILREIDGQADIAKELGGNTKLRDHYDALTWSEGWTDALVKKFESDRDGARKDITDMLAQETKKDGKMTNKGRALVDKLRNEGFLDKEGKLLNRRNLLQADMTLMQFAKSKGGVVAREADGKTHMYINLNSMGSETFPHELFHTIMRESPMKDHFTKSLIQKLVGSFDANGNLVRNGEVNINQVRKFFKKYIDLTSFDEDGTMNAVKSEETMKAVDAALAEFEQSGKTKKISDKSRDLLENYTEEFGAYYFSAWLMGRNRNTLFFGGELKGIEGLVERTKDGFMDFWQSKVSKTNPEFNFAEGLNASFDRSKGLGRISSMDYYMRDMVRAASNANQNAFRPDSMTLENLRDFERSNGLRNLTTPDGNRRLNPREQVTQNIRLGKEAHKIISGLDKNLRTSVDTVDDKGKPVITGRLSETELDALVKGGIVPRAWADKVNQGYAMLDGTVSNVFSAGYLGKTEQTTDASYPRLTGSAVAFKNRKAILFDVETKIKADGTFYTLFHTLDLAVIEQEANRLFQNTEYRKLFDGDRGVMEADFFKYLSNASKASTDTSKLDSAILLDKGDGLGAQRRDVLHQMGRMALQTGDAYKHQPIAVIPEGFRHSVTSFNIDGMTTPRVEGGARYDIDMKNAHKFIRENWQPDDMRQEKTPVGRVLTHESGFKFTQDANGRVSAYTNDGSKVGTFSTINEATTASKNLYNKAQDNIRKIAQVAKQKEVENRKNLQPLDEAFYEEAFRVGDMFKTKRMQEIVGNSRLVRQTFDEFLGQKVEEINSGKNEAEKGAILEQLFNSEFKELIELEAELKKQYEPLTLESTQLQEQEKEITNKIVELSQEKKRLQQFSDPDARVDVGILEMYGRIYKRKEEVNKRVSEIVKKQHDAGITDYGSHYYMTKRFLQMFNETGKLSEEAIAFALKPSLIKAFEANFETGKAVTFLANHGTPNHELMVSKTFNTAFLGRNTGSMSAFNATFFAGSKETSVNYVGNPIKMSWVRDFIDARSFYIKNLPIDVRVKIERALQSDTSKGVVQKTNSLQENLHKEFPDDFKLDKTTRTNKNGESIFRPSPITEQGGYISSLVDRILEGAQDEGVSFGGYEMAWKEEGRQPYLLRNIVKMDNPLVHEYAKADFRDETFASVIQRAKDAGHDGVIFKNTKDGGGLDTIFASFAKNEENKIFTLETTEDTRFAPRGNDEAGNKVKGGSEIEGRNYQPVEDRLPPTRDQGFNRVYRNISRSKKESINGIKQMYLNKWGIKLSDYEQFQQLTDAHYKLQQELGDGKHQGDNQWAIDELKDLKQEIIRMERKMTDDIELTQGDNAGNMSEQESTIQIGMNRIEQIVNTISSKPLDQVKELSGKNRLDAILQKELGSGFAREITGDDLTIAEAFREYAGHKYEQEMIKAAFESELYSTDTRTLPDEITGTRSEIYRKGILVDILKSENKINANGGAVGEVNPRRIINALRNRGGGDSKVYTEAKAIGLIDWLESKQEGQKQKKVTTEELLDFVEANKMGLKIDKQLEQHADFGDTRPYVTGGEEQAKKGYRVYVVRMTNPKHAHGVEGHFEGAVVHVRVTMRTTKDGKKVMHIEEIQANNTATDVLSDSQRVVVTKEVEQLKLFKVEYQNALLYTQAESSALKSRFGEGTADYAIAETARVSRWQANRDKIAGKYAEILYDLNPEPHQERYVAIGNKTRDGYISALAKSLPNMQIDMLVSERTTKLNNTKNSAPLQDPKEWVKVAFRTVLRKALVEGVDRITVTPWAETPIQVGMKAKSAERFYGKTITDAFNSELAKMNSALNVENKYDSLPDKRYENSKLKTSDAIQKVAKVVDVNEASSKGADVKTLFELLHKDDADIAKNHKASAFKVRMDTIVKQIPDGTSGKAELMTAVKFRAMQFEDFLTIKQESEMPNALTQENQRIKAINRGITTSEQLVDRSMGFDFTPEMKKNAARPQRMFQPAEGEQGGRVYDQNSPLWKSGFLGKYAEDNQDRIKNKNIEFVKRRDGSYRITLTDNSGTTKKIGHITADLDMSVKGEGVAEISSNIDPKFRGNKLANVLYSEMAERLRAMGVKYVDGTIVNKDGIPVQVRNTIIGQTYFKGSNKPASMQETASKVQAVQSVYPNKGIGVYNELDFNARYQPDEYIPNQERAKKLRSLIDTIPHYKEALESGQLTIDEYNPEAFKGLQVLAHAPDTASTIKTPNFIAQGGMGYPLLFKGEGWASVSRGLEKRLNRIGEANFQKTGKWQAPMALIMAHPFKMSGARNGAEGFVNVLKKMRDRNIVSDATLTQALKYALERAGVQGIGEKVYIGDMLGKTQKLLENSTSSGFKARAKFVKDVSGYVAKNSRQLSTIKLNRISDIIPDYPAGAKLTSKELIPAVFDMFVDPLLKGVDSPDSKMGGKVYAYVLFDKPLIEHSGSPHKSYNYSVKHNDNSPVRVDILSNPVEPIKSFTEKTYASGKSVPLKESTITNDTGQRNFPYGQVKHAQPIEFTQFTTEQTAAGRILKNAKGYAVMMVNNKFRVYNPAKVILGVYGNEEDAKKRIYREMPKR